MAWCWFDESKCREGLEALRQYRADYDEKKRVFRDEPRHDWTSHTADAFRYMAMAWRELRPEKPPEPPRFAIQATPGGMQINFGELARRHLERRAAMRGNYE